MPKQQCKQWTEDIKQQALTRLILNAGNTALTARQMRVPRKTLEYWQKQDPVKFEAYRIDKIKEFIDTGFDKLKLLFSYLTKEKMAVAPLKSISCSIAFIADKVALFEKISSQGQEKKPDEFENMTDEEIDKELARRLQERNDKSDTDTVSKPVN